MGAVVAISLSASHSEYGPAGPPSPEASADAGAELACTHFRDVLSDATAGILTDSELRTKLGEVYSNARISENPGIARDSQAMLAAATQGDSASLQGAATSFSLDCAGVGL